MIRIGVTGHRVLAETAKIESGVEAALARIEQSFPAQPLAVISALAEGADRIVARAVLERPGSQLIVALPLPESEYIKDFDSDASRAEFASLLAQAVHVERIPGADSRDHAYQAAGKFLLKNSDVLIAIWDGLAAQGEGGTGEIVSLARELNMPIAWVHAGNREQGTLRPTAIAEQGLVTFENEW